MKSTFLKLHPGLLMSSLIHSFLVLVALSVAILFWIGKVHVFPVYPLKYALNGVLILGISLAIWGLITDKKPIEDQVSEPTSRAAIHLIAYPVPAFIVNQFLNSDRIQVKDAWIPIANTFLIFLLLFGTAFIWHQLIRNSKQGYSNVAKQ